MLGSLGKIVMPLDWSLNCSASRTKLAPVGLFASINSFYMLSSPLLFPKCCNGYFKPIWFDIKKRSPFKPWAGSSESCVLQSSFVQIPIYCALYRTCHVYSSLWHINKLQELYDAIVYVTKYVLTIKSACSHQSLPIFCDLYNTHPTFSWNQETLPLKSRTNIYSQLEKYVPFITFFSTIVP